MINCRICGHASHSLLEHIPEHGLSIEEYLEDHEGAPTVSFELWGEYTSTRPVLKAPDSSDVRIDFAGVQVPVNLDVPEEDCLPMPPYYRIPEHGMLAAQVKQAAVSLVCGRSVYVWGLPGSGKDAFFHAFSARTRMPAEIFQVRPDTDIENWFYTRSFDKDGTGWEEGRLLEIARDGYPTESGERVPYMVLISDFDRADKSQAEAVRLLLDSIEGRIKGPGGTTYPLFPGTLFCFTANSSGAGDERGRCISSNPIDASILDRVERKYQFDWMDWRDEEIILRNKFPTLVEETPALFEAVGRATGALRNAVRKEEWYAEFTHRTLCAWLEHTQDLIEATGNTDPSVLRVAATCWLDGLPDSNTRQQALHLIDPFLEGGSLPEGDVGHIEDQDALDFFSN